MSPQNLTYYLLWKNPQTSSLPLFLFSLLFSIFSLQNVNYETAALRSSACQSLCTKKCQLNLPNNLILLQSQRLIPFLTFFTSVCHVFTLPRLDKHMVWDWVIPDSVTFLRDYRKTHARFNPVLYWSIRPLQTLSTYRCHLSSVTHQLKRLYKHQCLQVCTFFDWSFAMWTFMLEQHGCGTSTKSSCNRAITILHR